MDLAQVLDPEPTPALAAEMADECRRLLDQLGDAALRAVALGKMRGDTNAELAARLGVVEQTIERKLRRIRDLWDLEVER
jgi:DNA-directed RNA polymerase specialized sigma24 family protein